MAKSGKITEYLKTKDHVAALLHNFDVNSSQLKVEHSNWLKTVAKPYLAMSSATSWVVGLASTTGTFSWNQMLAQARATSARKVMTGLSPLCRVSDAEVAAGEAAARILGVADGVEDGRWRAVYVAIGLKAKVKIVPPPPPPPKPVMVNRRSYVRYILSFESGADEMGDRNDRRAAKIANSSSEFIRSCMEVSPSEEIEVSVDQNWTVTRIFIGVTENTSGSGIFKSTVKQLEVEFVWGPVTTERWIQRNGFKPDPLGDEEMNAWLAKPWSTYQHGFSKNTAANLLCR